MDSGTKSGLSPEISGKTAILCTNMPESLFDGTIAKQHFGRFGRVKKILLRPKKKICIVEYDSTSAAERALLNAGAFDGFMFDVTWNKTKIAAQMQMGEEGMTRRKRVKEDDPDWVPDTDVEEELNAMGAIPVYRQPRQLPMQQDQTPALAAVRKVNTGRSTLAKAARDRFQPSTSQKPASADQAVAVSALTTMSTAEAAAELQLLRSRVSRGPDEQKRTLDARDRVLRAWGGTGARVCAGGATIGTCPDMCPEKERLQREVEHQVNQLECEGSGGDGAMCAWRAVKQYSRSSADQETPMCYELRPARVLGLTMAYLLHEVADCTQHMQVSLADWFQFMWDRLRSIRKDITQQALCCAESVRLVEQCARFHAHCSARLAGLEHSQFDQRLNTDNLTKCLQTLKHMYADLPPASKPCEPEFRAYIALLNLGDANFCWEIKQLPQEIQKSEAVTFAVKIFMALDNNNYVRFFRLVREKATYLQACILLRYFNDVRARGLARIVKAYAPRGGSRYPTQELLDNLGFEDVYTLGSFITHYGLHFREYKQYDLYVILDRNKFIEDSDPYPISRAINLIESKNKKSDGETIAGGPLPDAAIYKNHKVHSSFNDNGLLKPSALLAEDLGYATENESNNDLNALKKALERTPLETAKNIEPKNNLFVKPAKASIFSASKSDFSFTPAIPVVSSDVVKTSPGKLFSQDTKDLFAFSKPHANKDTGLWGRNQSQNIFGASKTTSETMGEISSSKSLFGDQSNNQNIIFNAPTTQTNFFNAPSSVLGSASGKATHILSGNNQFKLSSQASPVSDNSSKATFIKSAAEVSNTENVFSTTPFTKPLSATNSIFGKPASLTDKVTSESVQTFFSSGVNQNVPMSGFVKNIFQQTTSSSVSQKPADIFGTGSSQLIFGQSKSETVANNPNEIPTKTDLKSFGSSSNLFNKQNMQEATSTSHSIPSPKTLFSSAFSQNEEKNKSSFPSSIFSENKVLNAAFGSLSQIQQTPEGNNQETQQKSLQDLMKEQDEKEKSLRLEQTKRLEEQRIQEQRRHEEKEREERRKQHEEIKKKEEEMRKQEELRRIFEEERKQAEIKRTFLEKRKAEEERRKTEERQRLIALIDKESQELVGELVNIISIETVEDLTAKEMEEIKILNEFANNLTEELLQEVSHYVCNSETKAEKFLTEKLMEKYFGIWIANTVRNIKRRIMVQETPVWITGKSPQQAAKALHRETLPAALSKMAEFHKGHIFTGNIKLEPELNPYNIMEVVKTSLLKGLKRVQVNYHECFFWKLSISSPGEGRWLNRKVNLQNWLLKKFTDRNYHADDGDSVIYLKKLSWNNLMNFAISVSMIEQQNHVDALNGSNGVMFYTDENDDNLVSRIEETLRNKCPKQVLPIVILASDKVGPELEKVLNLLQNEKSISAFKILKIDPLDTVNSIDKLTRTGLKWLAKNLPDCPPLEMDSLESILLRCVGMEFWYKLKLMRHTQMNAICKDLNKLICLYNAAIEHLTRILTNDSIRQYPSFPPELKKFLQTDSVLPKSYEFFPNDWANPMHVKTVKDILHSLKLQQTNWSVNTEHSGDFQNKIQNFCDETEWFENPTEVSTKIISYLPQNLPEDETNGEDLLQYCSQFDFINVLCVAVVEKINSIKELPGQYTVYEKSSLNDYLKSHWWYENKLIISLKHKAINFNDDQVDKAMNASFATNAKRMKLDESDNLVDLDDNDETLVEESINKWNSEIDKLNLCDTSLKELEVLLDQETAKASNLEEVLRAALNDTPV